MQVKDNSEDRRDIFAGLVFVFVFSPEVPLASLISASSVPEII